MAALSALCTLALAATVPVGARPAPAPQQPSPLNIVRGRVPRRGYVSSAALEHDALVRRSSNVPLLDNAPGGYDVEYLVNLGVGTPSQGFLCLFDTGSDILYVPTRCTSSDCTGHNQYQPSQSSTFVNLGQTVQIEYGKGSASGTAVQDVVTMGNYTVQQQAFVAANQISDGNPPTYSQHTNTAQDPSDCLIGISYGVIPATGTLEQNGFMQNLVAQGKLTSNSFGMYLTTAADVSGATTSGNATTNLVSGSEVCIDCVDTAKVSGSFSSVNLINPNYGYWAAKVDGVTVNGQLISGSSFNALFDSGTTFAGLPDQTLATVAQALGARESQTITSLAGGTGYSIACSNNLPATIGIQINGVNFPFVAENLVEQFTNSLCGLTFFGMGQQQQGDPLGGILGQTWLKGVYSQFNYNNGGSVAFANLSSNAASSSSTTTSVTGAKSAGIRSVAAPSIALMALAALVAAL